MNPYVTLASKARTPEGTSLARRLALWHDEMVAHERSLRVPGTSVRCGPECPHVEARLLWAEAQDAFETGLDDLTFLHSHARRRDGQRDGQTERRS